MSARRATVAMLSGFLLFSINSTMVATSPAQRMRHALRHCEPMAVKKHIGRGGQHDESRHDDNQQGPPEQATRQNTLDAQSKRQSAGGGGGKGHKWLLHCPIPAFKAKLRFPECRHHRHASQKARYPYLLVIADNHFAGHLPLMCEPDIKLLLPLPVKLIREPFGLSTQRSALFIAL